MAIIVSHVIDFRQKILSQLQCIAIYCIDISVLYSFNKYWANSSHVMKEDKDFEIEAASIALSEE